MRKWQDLAAQDDPNSWNAVSGMWPTDRGTYETADVSTATTVTGVASMTGAYYAFATGRLGAGSSTFYEHIVFCTTTSIRVGVWNGSTLTDLGAIGTNGLVTAGRVCMCNAPVTSGQAILAIAGSGVTTLYTATSSTLTSIVGSPSGRNIVCTQSNVVLAFSSDDTAWNTSDVGAPTTWSGGESSSGTFYGISAVSAAVPYGNDVYVLSPERILRMTYIGGTSIKWNVQTAWVGTGVPLLSSTNISYQDWAVATAHGIVYYGGNGKIFLFDGASQPRLLNPLTTIPVETIRGVFTYDPTNDVLCIAPGRGSSSTGTAKSDGSSSTFTSLYHYYNFAGDAWGTGVGNDSEQCTSNGSLLAYGVVRGNFHNRNQTSSKPVYWMITDTAAGTIKRSAPSDPASSTVCYLQTMKAGSNREKMLFDRLSVKGRRRTDLGSGSASLSFELFRELEDTSAQATRAVTESTSRKRFDLNGGAAVDNFGRFKVTWTGLDVEVEDFDIIAKKAGVE